MALVQLYKILVHCHLFHKKLGLQSLEIYFYIQVTFTLLPCSEALSHIQYTCVSFQIDSPVKLNIYDINQPLFTCSNSPQQLQTNF